MLPLHHTHLCWLATQDSNLPLSRLTAERRSPGQLVANKLFHLVARRGYLSVDAVSLPIFPWRALPLVRFAHQAARPR